MVEVERPGRSPATSSAGAVSGASLPRRAAAAVVAEHKGVVAGYAIVLFRPHSAAARLYSIAVAPALRGRGIGPALIAAAEQEALRRDRVWNPARSAAPTTRPLSPAIARQAIANLAAATTIRRPYDALLFESGCSRHCIVSRTRAPLSPPDHRLHLRPGLPDDGAGLGPTRSQAGAGAGVPALARGGPPSS